MSNLETKNNLSEKDTLGSVPREIIEIISIYDRQEKALTGRTPERLEEETGIEVEELFPEEGKILYVGDPYQVMGRYFDNPNFTTIDYEFGETAGFEGHKMENFYEPGGFHNIADQQVQIFEDNIREYYQKLADGFDPKEIFPCQNEGEYYYVEWIEMIQPYLENAIELSQEAMQSNSVLKNKKKFLDASRAWDGIAEFYNSYKPYVPEEENVPEITDVIKRDLKDFWYLAKRGANLFSDLVFYEEELKPKLENKIQLLEKKSGKKLDQIEKQEIIDKLIRPMIDNHRMKKRTEKSHVLQAMFPELPFKDSSFDRFVASWSISAHLFHRMNKEQYDHSFAEILRVLRDKGKAYIFPLSYQDLDKTNMTQSLNGLMQNNEFTWQMLNSNGLEIKNDEYNQFAYTLLIEKKS